VKTVDFLLTAKRDMAAAKRFFDKAMGANGYPEKVAMDKSGSNKAAIDAINADLAVPILARQVKYLNNIRSGKQKCHFYEGKCVTPFFQNRES
jgi:transposase-like protein